MQSVLLFSVVYAKRPCSLVLYIKKFVMHRSAIYTMLPSLDYKAQLLECFDLDASKPSEMLTIEFQKRILERLLLSSMPTIPLIVENPQIHRIIQTSLTFLSHHVRGYPPPSKNGL